MHTGSSAAKNAGEHISFRTTCWREIRVGLLALGGTRRPACRVSLDIGPSSDTGPGTWAGLTPGEARQLAAALLAQAAAADHRGAFER
ncbi:MAG TPA: hypothetical protein VE733_06650 [Streptosporangiaceae bacterium]|jgi:hypothetical protein|nr:hypothetical protein [Streptosporangiaceae bacterium]